MSHYFLKTKYSDEGDYGTIVERNLYCHHNLSCDIVSIYDYNGTCLFSFDDSMSGNLFDAMKLLVEAWNDKGEIKTSGGIDFWTKEDHEFLNR